MNRQSFATWLRPTRGLRFDGETLVVQIPSVQFQHIGKRYEDEFAEALRVMGGVSELRFEA